MISSTNITVVTTDVEKQFKCSSLPPGLVGPGADSVKLSRSQSNAGSQLQNLITALEDEDVKEERKSESSFFGRFFPRKSGKKKKKDEKETICNKNEDHFTTNSEIYSQKTIQTRDAEICYKSINYEQNSFYTKLSETQTIGIDSNLSIRPNALIRSGPSARQRIQPIDIPSSPELIRQEFNTHKLHSPGTSPLQVELESHFKQKISSINTPAKFSEIEQIKTPPTSPKFTNEKYNSNNKITASKFIERSLETKTDESKSKVRIAGLSSLQQRVLSLNDDIDNGNFKSLTAIPFDETQIQKPVVKSQSFKIVKSSFDDTTIESNNLNPSEDKNNKLTISTHTQSPLSNKNMQKAASLDSIKNVDVKDKEINYNSKLEIGTKEQMKLSLKETATDYSENTVTISGPSHTAIINIANPTNILENTNNISNQEKIDNEKEIKVVENHVKEHVSVTKIQVKRESIQSIKSDIPEFLNIQLNKVEVKPNSNVVLTTSTSPKIIEEQSKPKYTFNKTENLDIVSKIEGCETEHNNTEHTSLEQNEVININSLTENSSAKTESAKVITTAYITVVPTSLNSRIYRKHSESMSQNIQERKSSLCTENTNVPGKEFVASKSKSLDFDIDINKSSDNSEIYTETVKVEQSAIKQKVANENTVEVILRRKSLVKQKNEDEPELMKVFARRSLKLKDSESESLSQQVILMVDDNNSGKSRDSDKENQLDSPTKERKITYSKVKEPLSETKHTEKPEVVLRQPVNNKTYNFQRAVSLNTSKNNENPLEKLPKQNSLFDRPKTENWISPVNSENCAKNEIKQKISQEEIITSISQKPDYIGDVFNKPKNFSQRKAEWEKRAQEALKKTLP